MAALRLNLGADDHTYNKSFIRRGKDPVWAQLAALGRALRFFQAKAAGLYDKAGLDVELKPGGPDVNTPLLVGVEQLDLAIGTGFTTLNMVEEGIPGVTVAAFFQKDPQTLVAHPDQGIATLADVKGRPVMISAEARQEFWQFLKLKFGFKDKSRFDADAVKKALGVKGFDKVDLTSLTPE